MDKAPSGLRVVLAPAARIDLGDIRRWSETQFGNAAALRYQALIIQALLDLSLNPERAGVTQRAELPDGVRLYHLQFSRDHVAGERVIRPRHIVAFRARNAKARCAADSA